MKRFLPDRLFRAERAASYLPLAWLLTFFPSLALSAFVASLVSDTAQPAFPAGSWTVFLLVVVVAPVGETLIMGSVLLILRRFVGASHAVFMSAVGWGVAHSLQALAWGFVIWWPFLIFSTVFLVWRERGLVEAFTIVSLLHAMHNLIPGLGLVFAP